MLNDNLIKNNEQDILEKLSPVKKYREFNLPPDFFFDIFNLGTSTDGFTAREIGFAGNNISILNSFIPGNFEKFSLYYHTRSDSQNTFTTTQNQINRYTIPILPSINYEVQYNKLYRTLTGPNAPVVITNDNFTFVHNKAWSTPIIALLSRDIRPVVNESFKPDSFKYNFTSTIPTSGSVSNNTIDVLHGWNDLVKISIIITTAINPITITLSQIDRQGNLFDDFVVVPGTFPYNQTFIMPERTAGQARFTILGGGVGETGKIEVDFIFSSRG
jgi:hypothetical protein